MSKILTEMGVAHRNEEDVGFGYMADIFIPYVMGAGGSSKHGYALEFDGPTHFDTYYSKRPIGATVLKHRHVTRLGQQKHPNKFKLAVIPYWTYSSNMTHKAKKKIIQSALQAADEASLDI